MASHRRLKTPGKARVSVLTATAAAAVAFTPSIGHADPAPTKDQVKAEINQLQNDAEAATEQYDGFSEHQQELQQQVAQSQQRIVQQQSDLIALQDSMGALARAEYRAGGMDPTLQFLMSDKPDQYLSKASAINQLSAQQVQTLRQIQAKRRQLDQDREEAAGQLDSLEQTRKDLASKKAEIEGKLNKAQALLNTLSKADRLAIANEPGHGTAGQGGGGLDTSNLVPSIVDVPASGRAAAAVAAATRALGAPYVWGATGPSSFDCSGLTGWAWKQAGVQLPRTSQEQARAGASVPVSQIAPGDLVIYYGDAHHVGIYVGGGRVIHAPKPGSTVRYAPLNSMPIYKVVRVS